MNPKDSALTQNETHLVGFSPPWCLPSIHKLPSYFVLTLRKAIVSYNSNCADSHNDDMHDETNKYHFGW
jgi:hypothetical protein